MPRRLEALQILQHDTARRQRLQQRASQLRGLLLEGGLVLAGYRGTAAAAASLNPAGSPIVGVLLGDEQSALQASATAGGRVSDSGDSPAHCR